MTLWLSELCNCYLTLNGQSLQQTESYVGFLALLKHTARINKDDIITVLEL